MDIVPPKDSNYNADIVVFADHLSDMTHLDAVPDSIDGKGTSMLFIYRVFRQHGLPVAIIVNRDHRFTGKFCISMVKVHGTQLFRRGSLADR